MKLRLRSRSLSATILLLALALVGSGTAWAAIVVTSSMIRDETIQSRDVRNGSIAGIDVRNDALTGTDIAEATLGTVPAATTATSAASATTATTATSATTATTASNANALGGVAAASYARADQPSTVAAPLAGAVAASSSTNVTVTNANLVQILVNSSGSRVARVPITWQRTVLGVPQSLDSVRACFTVSTSTATYVDELRVLAFTHGQDAPPQTLGAVTTDYTSLTADRTCVDVPLTSAVPQDAAVSFELVGNFATAADVIHLEYLAVTTSPA